MISYLLLKVFGRSKKISRGEVSGNGKCGKKALRMMPKLLIFTYYFRGQLECVKFQIRAFLSDKTLEFPHFSNKMIKLFFDNYQF